ncbi:GNAT family N-acetyltransferase [Paenibacillus polymyxa]|uniref:GNAT family N-acetyltransferase n=1 Tax=Paenibacillus polymyxa TaxID=1406 RepID=UPI00042E9791|nr:GNAT family N-acetyltransferase [Paenibacillus polymyxa]AHM68157.1 gcn5-like N-acetyltransferase [Paenibacillus polymyxa SQR-21]AIY08897.1 acetyltransferase [Paenibacillus polymyxa]KAE8561393.1 GNAT family N-acetyltransferase [Paenibacillus polymyxa]MCJ1222994.1 GNAT family N-acetyltransferase [Paenibacillus polymyxa]MEE4581285.1 GNAT family N-acetyltransferase [Paenibacillus polymyxa]
MEIRQLQSEEFEAAIGLSQYAFQFTMTPEDLEKAKKKFKPEQTWGIFDGPDLNAKLTLLPLQVYIHGQVFDMGGIAGVATWPEKRRGGMVSRLLTHALEEMKTAGQSLSFLHPFSFAFYRKFGWETYTEYKKYVIPIDKFPAKLKTEGIVKRDIKNISELDQVYQSYASRYNGTLVRDKAWWQERILNENYRTVVYYTDAGDPQGYALYKIEDKQLNCDELVYENETARRALWTYFANHDSMITQGKFIYVPADDNLPFLLDDPRIQQETVPYFMGRIVDAVAFVERYPFEQIGEETSLTLHLTDRYAPWNEGVWRLTITTEGQGHLARVDTSNLSVNDTVADLELGIQSLTTLMLGYQQADNLFNWGRIEGSSESVAALKRVVPTKQTFLLDFF